MIAEQVANDERTTTGRTIEVTAESSAQVLGDADALSRVLSNLIDNAAKYSLSNSPIEVRVAEEESARGAIVVIEVADRGPGIPEGELEDILEPFARLGKPRFRAGPQHSEKRHRRPRRPPQPDCTRRRRDRRSARASASIGQ
jgi:signal transduction histidine kinase